MNEGFEEFEEKAKRALKKQVPLWLIGVVLLIVIGIVITTTLLIQKPEEPEPEIVTHSVLERIVNVSELSTFEAVYNGIAQVNNEKKPNKVDYYVSYEAIVKVGFDISKIHFDIDDATKHIVVYVPNVSITDINVDIASLDYIFVNDKANTDTVSYSAYKACEEDVAQESENQSAIFELAQQNAENFVRALVVPFVEQMDAAYTIEFTQEG